MDHDADRTGTGEAGGDGDTRDGDADDDGVRRTPGEAPGIDPATMGGGDGSDATGGGHGPADDEHGTGDAADGGGHGDSTDDAADAADDDRPRLDVGASGRVESAFVAPQGSAPMEARDRVRAVPGGIEGDRYFERTGYFAPYDVCEVTLVGGEDLDAVRAETGIDLSDGRHRRNLVVRGLPVRGLLDTEFRIGGARMRGTRPRPPCAHVEELAGEEGMATALQGRGGICADVLVPGEVAPGDPVEVRTADPRTEGRRIVERLRSEAGDEDPG